MPERLTDAELRQLAADQTPQPTPCPCGSPRIYEPCNHGFWVCERTTRKALRLDEDLQHLWLTRWKPPVTDPRVLAAVTELLERRAEDFNPFAADPALGPVVFHADPAAPLEPEDWPAAFEE